MAICFGVIVGLIMWLYPAYNVYASRMDGQALLAQAEVYRAEGVAKANTIIGTSLKDNEAYLRYLWITDVASASTDKTVVYIPTEANMPILEASRIGYTGKPKQ